MIQPQLHAWSVLEDGHFHPLARFRKGRTRLLTLHRHAVEDNDYFQRPARQLLGNSRRFVQLFLPDSRPLEQRRGLLIA